MKYFPNDFFNESNEHAYKTGQVYESTMKHKILNKLQNQSSSRNFSNTGTILILYFNNFMLVILSLIYNSHWFEYRG